MKSIGKRDAELWKVLAGSLGIASFGLLLLSRPLINRLNDYFLKTIMTDPYAENLWGFISAATRTRAQNIIENNLRACEGGIIERPFGKPRRFKGTEGLLFNIAQLANMPTGREIPIDTEVVLGPLAARPLKISMPIMVSGMAYGLGLSEKTKIALARGSSLAGTATNTGEGPFLLAERRAAKYLVIQYDRGGWNHKPGILKQADMVEIFCGQGAAGGIARSTAYNDIPAKARRLMGLKPGQPAVTGTHIPGISEPRRDLPPLVNRLREITGGAFTGGLAGHSKVQAYFHSFTSKISLHIVFQRRPLANAQRNFVN